MSEQQLQAAILKYLTAIGAYAVKIVVGNRAGVPDIIGSYKGKFIAIEVKVGKNTPSALQLMHKELIGRAGGVAIIAYKLEDVMDLIKLISHSPTSAR